MKPGSSGDNETRVGVEPNLGGGQVAGGSVTLLCGERPSASMIHMRSP